MLSVCFLFLVVKYFVQLCVVEHLAVVWFQRRHMDWPGTTWTGVWIRYTTSLPSLRGCDSLCWKLAENTWTRMDQNEDLRREGQNNSILAEKQCHLRFVAVTTL